jgi:pyruvate,orthophosphate dikinase
LGKVCLVGCASLTIDSDERGATIGGQALRQGHWIALDGAAGEISLGRRDIVVEIPKGIKQLMDEATATKRLNTA